MLRSFVGALLFGVVVIAGMMIIMIYVQAYLIDLPPDVVRVWILASVVVGLLFSWRIIRLETGPEQRRTRANDQFDRGPN